MTDSLSSATGAAMCSGRIVELRRLFSSNGARALLYLETFGPTASIKDRVAEALFGAAFNLGQISKDTQIVEATSGSFGVALARLAAARGLEATIVAPESLPDARRELLQRFGAKLILTPTSHGMTGAVQKARAIVAANRNAWSPNLFDNPANPSAYEVGTAPNVWRETLGGVDAFVAGVGSGGAFVGVSRFLRRKNERIERIAVEPSDSATLSGGIVSRVSSIPGLGAGFVPSIFDRSLPTRIATVTPDEAADWRERLARIEGLQVGLSTGANVAVIARMATQREYYGKTLVTLAFSRE